VKRLFGSWLRDILGWQSVRRDDAFGSLWPANRFSIQDAEVSGVGKSHGEGRVQVLGVGRNPDARQVQAIGVPAGLDCRVGVMDNVGVSLAGLTQQIETFVRYGRQFASETLGKPCPPSTMSGINVVVDSSTVVEEGEEAEDIRVASVLGDDQQAVTFDSSPMLGSVDALSRRPAEIDHVIPEFIKIHSLVNLWSERRILKAIRLVTQVERTLRSQLIRQPMHCSEHYHSSSLSKIRVAVVLRDAAGIIFTCSFIH
jgi:hypothetical protein